MRTGMAVLLMLVCVGCSTQDENAPQAAAAVMEERSPAGQPLAGRDTAVIQVAAKVKSVDLATRRVTLIGPEGENVTLKAGDQVQRLSEVKPGDEVVVEYMESVAFEVRPPTKEEKANPMVLAVDADRTQKTEAPAGAVVGMLHQIVKIIKIDKAAGTVTIKLPNGASEAIKAKYPENLDRVKVGDTVAVTYTEAVAVGLSPAATK